MFAFIGIDPIHWLLLGGFLLVVFVAVAVVLVLGRNRGDKE
jgi:hypothetical protein